MKAYNELSRAYTSQSIELMQFSTVIVKPKEKLKLGRWKGGREGGRKRQGGGRERERDLCL